MTEGTTPNQATTPPPLDGTPPPPLDGPPPVDIASIAAPPVRPAPKPASRVTLALSWVTALIIAAFAGWIGMRAAEGGTAYRLGVAFGTALFPFLIAAVVRIGFYRLRYGGGGIRTSLRSPWFPLTAALLAALTAAGDIAALAPPAPVDAATAMHVSAPFTLRETDPATVQQIEQGLREDPATRSVAVREVVGADGSVSVLMAADASLRKDDITEVAKGMQESSGVVPTIETIGGHEVAIITGPEGVLATWTDAPVLFSVFAPDLPTLRAVIEAVIASG